MTLSPLTHDAFGEVSVADAYVCRWASLRAPVSSGFDVMPAHGPQFPDVVVRPLRMPPLRKPLSKKKLLRTCSLLGHEISQCRPAHELRLVLHLFNGRQLE